MDVGNNPNRLSELYINSTEAACPFETETHIDFVEVSEGNRSGILMPGFI